MTPYALHPDNAALDGFGAAEVRVGTIRAAWCNEKARQPALVLDIDFGPERKISSAQITQNYRPEELIGRQVVALVNILPRRVAGIVSQVLVLAAVDPVKGTVLLRPDQAVANGTRIS